MPLVGVIMGSASDEEAVRPTLEILESLGVEYEVRVMSAHRTPERVHEYASGAQARGLEVLIAAAGGSAALGGALAAQTILPVIGIPLTSSALNGWDALLSTAQMPPGIPVGAMAVGSWGARNAAYYAAQILAIKHDHIRSAVAQYRQSLRER